MKQDKMPAVSIIIPVKKINNFVRQAMPYLLTLDYPNYEVLLVTDYQEPCPWENVRLLPSGEVGPAEKRDLGERKARGEFLAFIDDDAYPKKDWLKTAIKGFSNKDIAIVCGPGIAPPFTGWRERVSESLSESKFCWGSATFRNRAEGSPRFVEDFITANMIARRSDYRQVGGFSTAFWPGEDTSFCLGVIQRGKKILYHPEVVVYHHRRGFGAPYFRQIGAYGRHRGFFAKRFPKTSLRLAYFIPTISLLGAVIGGVSWAVALWQREPHLAVELARWLFSFLAGIYLALALREALLAFRRRGSLLVAGFVPLGIIATHAVYGTQFLRGLLTRDLRSSLRK